MLAGSVPIQPPARIDADSFADLEIRLFQGQKDEGDRYTVELRLDGQQEYRGHFVLDWVNDRPPKEAGEALFQCLFREIAAPWAEIRGRRARRRIRLWIDADAPALHRIPWELLRERPENGVATDLAAADATPFSRYPAGAWEPGNPILQRPIRMLVAIANPDPMPDDLPPIDVATEFDSLKQALGAAVGDQIELDLLREPCSPRSLETALRRGYHILHFIGHGQYAEKLGARLVMDNPGNPDGPYVMGDDLAAMLRRLLDGTADRDDRLRLVFLASCDTARTSPADAFRGLAPGLVRAGVPAAVAMQEPVAILAARDFAASFYGRLIEHGQVDLAMNQARSGLLSAGLPGAHIPVLYMRLRSGQLLGRPGRVAGGENAFWPHLVDKVRAGLCVPFLGPRVTAGLVPDEGSLASAMAAHYEYPFGDREDLARVAQFVATSNPAAAREAYMRFLVGGARERLRALAMPPAEPGSGDLAEEPRLAEIVRAARWSERILAVRKDEIHHLLARLELPLYVTTNHDPFMVEALNHPALVERRGGKPARREGPRWASDTAGRERYPLTPVPSRSEPVVFHLNGHDGDEEWADRLVLSEDDYLQHLVRLSRDQGFMLPSNLFGNVPKKMFLFIGYDLGDWSFRVLLRGLIESIEGIGKTSLHVGVQLEHEHWNASEAAREYLSNYLRKSKITIYWGTPHQFMRDLHARLPAQAIAR